ncbi:hypothetical protein GLOIN_2v1695656 [Rhizophagus clarus]|uniref:Crinkler effector protein N-terminal domain-containing protein n=1 Tax=Rhizophagus clarus TaxID=94130 RepID=A0A8H3M9U1_9GLOM|nr:hypothetical protein GLOIN_2v1695656 [Rhizophagus clarus]
MNNLQDYHGDINTIQIESKYNFYKMPERNITCFLQGVEEEFRVDVDGLETIKDLKNLIACQKTKFIRGINVDEYKIWEIRSNDDIIRLKDNPAERKDSTALNEYQRILGLFGENLDENHICIFMGKPHTEVEMMKEIIKDMAGHVRELEETIRDLTDKIQIVIVNDSSDEELDGFLRNVCNAEIIMTGDELWVHKNYESKKGNPPKHVSIGCKVNEIDSNGILHVVIFGYDEEKKLIYSLEQLEKWLLKKFGLEKEFRNKNYSRNAIMVKHVSGGRKYVNKEYKRK